MQVVKSHFIPVFPKNGHIAEANPMFIELNSSQMDFLLS